MTIINDDGRGGDDEDHTGDGDGDGDEYVDGDEDNEHMMMTMIEDIFLPRFIWLILAHQQQVSETPMFDWQCPYKDRQWVQPNGRCHP